MAIMNQLEIKFKSVKIKPQLNTENGHKKFTLLLNNEIHVFYDLEKAKQFIRDNK